MAVFNLFPTTVIPRLHSLTLSSHSGHPETKGVPPASLARTQAEESDSIQRSMACARALELSRPGISGSILHHKVRECQRITLDFEAQLFRLVSCVFGGSDIVA